ncbi:hypothetical protein T11_645 [Trichinella zimbabwensis]|uniref:Uncharacterized protein n=1 Tax=Trichinella zimbabwensis TaxID=268475 RepID=A0A0V1I6K1_9BILA|nr:hypothetical protein T11_645 [Trichinella zimbabwensis]
MHPSDISRLAVIVVVAGMVASAMFTLLPTAYPEHFGFVKMTNENDNAKQCVDDNVRVELFQIFVRLTGADKKDRLSGDVSHGNGGANFVIDGVEFGEHNSVDGRILLVDGRAVDQSSAELLQLVDRLVADQRLANEQHQVWLVDSDQLAQGAHQRFVVLHTAGRVHQHHVQVVRIGVAYSRGGDRGRVLTVTLFVELNQTRVEFVQVADVGAQLFDRARPESVAGGNEHPEAILVQPKCHFGQVGRLADAVDTAKHDTVAPSRLSGLEDVAQQTAVPLRLEQQLHQALSERIPDHAGDQAELTDHTAPQAGANRLAQLVRHFGGHIFADQLFLHLFQRSEQQIVGQRLVADQTLKSRQKTTAPFLVVVVGRVVELLLLLCTVVVVTQTTQFTTHLAHVTSLLFNRRLVQHWIHCRRPCRRIASIGLTAAEIQRARVVELGIATKLIPTAILFDLFAFQTRICRHFAASIVVIRLLLFRLGSFQKILTHFCQLRLHHHRVAVLHCRVRIQLCWNSTRRHWHRVHFLASVVVGGGPHQPAAWRFAWPWKIVRTCASFLPAICCHEFGKICESTGKTSLARRQNNHCRNVATRHRGPAVPGRTVGQRCRQIRPKIHPHSRPMSSNLLSKHKWKAKSPYSCTALSILSCSTTVFKIALMPALSCSDGGSTFHSTTPPLIDKAV